MMDITPIMIKMIKEAHGHHHDINHFMKVHSFARTIGLKENAKNGGQKKPHCDGMIQEVIELIDQMVEENDR